MSNSSNLFWLAIVSPAPMFCKVYNLSFQIIGFTPPKSSPVISGFSLTHRIENLCCFDAFLSLMSLLYVVNSSMPSRQLSETPFRPASSPPQMKTSLGLIWTAAWFAQKSLGLLKYSPLGSYSSMQLQRDYFLYFQYCSSAYWQSNFSTTSTTEQSLRFLLKPPRRITVELLNTTKVPEKAAKLVWPKLNTSLLYRSINSQLFSTSPPSPIPPTINIPVFNLPLLSYALMRVAIQELLAVLSLYCVHLLSFSAYSIENATMLLDFE